MIARGNLRLGEGPTAGNPLANDAKAALDREELLAAFAEACLKPAPRYSDAALLKLFPRAR